MAEVLKNFKKEMVLSMLAQVSHEDMLILADHETCYLKIHLQPVWLHHTMSNQVDGGVRSGVEQLLKERRGCRGLLALGPYSSLCHTAKNFSDVMHEATFSTLPCVNDQIKML